MKHEGVICMTEAMVRDIIHKEMPNRVISSIEKIPRGYLVFAYDRDVGPLDVSGTAFFVRNNGYTRKLSISELVRLMK